MKSAVDVSEFVERGYLQARLDEIVEGRASGRIEVGVVHGGVSRVARVAHSAASRMPGAFNAGCITKLLVAELLRQAVATGRVELDGSVAEYLRGATAHARKVYSRITLRQLLDHTHGLDDSALGDAPRLSNGRIDALLLTRRLVAAERLFASGTLYSYSSAGAWLIAAVLERMAGVSWQVLLRERLFAPLQLSAAHGESLAAAGAGARLCPAIGRELTVTVTDLLRFLDHVMTQESDVWPDGASGPEHDADIGAKERGSTGFDSRRDGARPGTSDCGGSSAGASMGRDPHGIVRLPGYSPFERGIHRGWKSYGEHWFGHHSTWPGASILVRIRPRFGTVLVVASQQQPALLVAARLFGRRLPEVSGLKLPRRLTVEEIEGMDLTRLAGVYATAAETTRIRVSAGSLRLDARPRSAAGRVSPERVRSRRNNAAVPEQGFGTRLQPAAAGVFLPEPGAADTFPFVQFIERNGGAECWLWNGRCVIPRCRSTPPA